MQLVCFATAGLDVKLDFLFFTVKYVERFTLDNVSPLDDLPLK